MGQPEKSLLLKAVGYQDDDLRMPPKGQLPEPMVAVLQEWVRRGAPWPGEKATTSRRPGLITPEDRAWWAFQPVRVPALPAVNDAEWSKNPLDRFIKAQLDQEGLAPAPVAEPRALVRRVYFDLTGLPPTPVQVDEFVTAWGAAGASRQAIYESLVDRLLASPRYGERMARVWLDLVRYAESDGFRLDTFRSGAWRYRDWVIRAFNSDKPYDQFLREQLAGDEIDPDNPECLTATGYLCHGIYEYNQRDARTQWNDLLNEVTDVTADVVLGLGMGCARCHDHKFDPILQKDYFRLQAFFAPLLPRDDTPLATAEELAAHHARLTDWEQKTAEIRQELDEIERPHRERISNAAIEKFPKDIRPMLRKPPAERSPFEVQIVELALRQVALEQTNLKMETKLKDEPKEKWAALKKRLAEYDADKPPPLAVANAVTDVSPVAPPTFIPGDRAPQAVEPGFLTILDPSAAAIKPSPAVASQSTGRRTELARWITSRDNPLPARVIVNRVWQFHFGRGLVKTSSDFGHLGEPPSHSELLDWLAAGFMDEGWEFKPLHRKQPNKAS